ncbi:glycosyltransferase [Pedobacter sp. HMF7647]|uniref:Glycosyltransferase n=1 Tax=Hufsiella arboris TaxID=2695275 RepID=A0A7K1YAW3_9SPHI|nr:glycosyltransferase family 2 protein [Hufsiella arboris]MXV51725.1 glycosyltransferase [Hufsiella arboris]
MIPIISIIYVNYNSSDLLIQSAESLFEKCKTNNYEVIIVDNSSGVPDKANLMVWLSKHNDKTIRLIQNESNYGFGRANNTGSQNAKGRYLFFLNPDTIVLNDVLWLFRNFLENSEVSVAACGGSLLKADLTPNDSYGNFPGLLQEIGQVGLGVKFLFRKYYADKVVIAKPVSLSTPMRVPYIVGADIFIKKDVFLSVGGFDETYFMYYEETDLFKKLACKGMDSFVLPDAKIIHLEGSGVRPEASFNYWKFEQLLKSKLNYHAKWNGFVKLWLIKAIIPLQIFIQYLKGNMGQSLSKPFKIYGKVLGKI